MKMTIKTKMQNTKLIAPLLLGLLAIVSFQNCSKIAVRDVASQSPAAAVASASAADPAVVGEPVTVTTPAAPVCQTQLIDALRPVKVLFLVDTSGSNAGSGGTDDGKKWRSSVLNSFLSRYASKDNFKYGLVTFKGQAATPQIMVGGQAVFSNDSAVLKAGMASFMATADEGLTPYKAALKMAQKLIAQDLIDNPSTETAYSVVMISDGGATDYNNNPDNVIPDVDSIVSMAPNQISLNSVFYYGAKMDLTQTKYLDNIAKIGQGVFVTANSSQVFNIDDVMKVPQTTCR